MGYPMKNGTRWDFLELDTRKPLYVRYPKQNRPTSWLRLENSLQLKLLQSAWAIGRLFCGPMEKALIDPTLIHPKVRHDLAGLQLKEVANWGGLTALAQDEVLLFAPANLRSSP
jgi:hypothetical protein